MIHTSEGLFLHNDSTKKYLHYISADHFFCVLDIPDYQDKKDHVKKAIEKHIQTQGKIDLSIFEDTIADIIKEENLPISTSLACGYIQDNIFYLKTVGRGTIYIHRNDQTQQIIQGNNSASGYIQNNDILIFTTMFFIESFKKHDTFSNVLKESRHPSKIAEKLNKLLEESEDLKNIALLIKTKITETEIEEKKEEENINTNPKIKNKEIEDAEYLPPENLKTKEIKKTKFKIKLLEKKKTFIVVGLIIIIGIFIWSVLLGHKRRTEAEMQEKINNTKEILISNLKQAEELAYIQPQKALEIIEQANQEIGSLRNKLNGNKESEIEKLQKIVEKSQNKISKKKQTKAEEFYDLALENKNAQGSKIYLLNDETFMILDDKNGIIYLLDIEKKALDVIESPKIKDAQYISGYKDTIRMFKETKGVYSIGNKIDLMIEDKKKYWGKIVDMNQYYGNVYLLDKENNQIHKYILTEAGYAPVVDYFAPGTINDLSSAKAMHIDSSIYVAFDKKIEKYTKGLLDNFNFSIPINDLTIEDFYTDYETENIFVWDKNNQALYIIDKKGTYKKQLNSELLGNANDFVVYQDEPYIISESKIYKMLIRQEDQ